MKACVCILFGDKFGNNIYFQQELTVAMNINFLQAKPYLGNFFAMQCKTDHNKESVSVHNMRYEFCCCIHLYTNIISRLLYTYLLLDGFFHNLYTFAAFHVLLPITVFFYSKQ